MYRKRVLQINTLLLQGKSRVLFVLRPNTSYFFSIFNKQTHSPYPCWLKPCSRDSAGAARVLSPAKAAMRVAFLCVAFPAAAQRLFQPFASPAALPRPALRGAPADGLVVVDGAVGRAGPGGYYGWAEPYVFSHSELERIFSNF